MKKTDRQPSVADLSQCMRPAAAATSGAIRNFGSFEIASPAFCGSCDTAEFVKIWHPDISKLCLRVLAGLPAMDIRSGYSSSGLFDRALETMLDTSFTTAKWIWRLDHSDKDKKDSDKDRTRSELPCLPLNEQPCFCLAQGARA